MAQRDDLTDTTRRTVLKATAAALGVGAATGTASAHEWNTTQSGDGNPNRKPEQVGKSTPNVSDVGYHSGGGRGAESSRDGQARNPHYGAFTEIRTHGDYAYVGMFSSRGDSEGRGMAVVDIGEYNRATTESEVEDAEMRVVSFLRNTNAATAMMDLKVSDDGEFVFVGTQPITALFDETPTSPGYDVNDSSTSGPNTGGVLAVDVSDPFAPTLVDAEETFTTGIHNLFHHRIGGSEYVFACKDIELDGTAGVYVFEFDRGASQLSLVNRWTATGGNNAQGEVTPTGGMDFYCHDLEVQDDPRTGRPTVYVAYWNAGVRVLDATDPTAMEEVGHFDMRQAHFVTPAPDLVAGKRVVVASHEEPGSDSDGSTSGAPVEGKTNPYSTGTVFLADADGIYDHVLDNGEKTGEPTVTELGELDDWTWQDAAERSGKDDIEFANFELSPHNSEVARHADGSFWVHQAHYHGGIRFLKVEPGSDDGVTGPSGERDASGVDWSLTDEGWTRPDYGVPDESTMQGLSGVTPNVWGAVESNGVTFASDINQGILASRNEDIPLGGGPAIAEVVTADDGFVFTGGGTDQIDLELAHLARYDSVTVRDRLAPGWEVVGGDDASTALAGGSTFVEFDAETSEGDTRTYFVEAPSESGTYQFGPVEVSPDGGDTWQAVPGTIRSNYVAGTGVALGTAAGAVGVLGSQRERLHGRLSGWFGREE
jgi:hypothetical protein